MSRIQRYAHIPYLQQKLLRELYPKRKIQPLPLLFDYTY